jgi:hypothetical protein
MDSVTDTIVSYCLLLRLNSYHCLIFQRQVLAYVCVIQFFIQVTVSESVYSHSAGEIKVCE